LNVIDSIAAVGFAAASAATFLAFGFDKWRARRSGQRLPESWLLLLAAFGGWPGGLLGMKLFRHKTSKGYFLFKFAVALVPFLLEVYAWYHWR
jgi:uncharacterized membrane protein YsdA (DUF1294 family)